MLSGAPPFCMVVSGMWAPLFLLDLILALALSLSSSLVEYSMPSWQDLLHGLDSAGSGRASGVARAALSPGGSPPSCPGRLGRGARFCAPKLRQTTDKKLVSLLFSLLLSLPPFPSPSLLSRLVTPSRREDRLAHSPPAAPSVAPSAAACAPAAFNVCTRSLYSLMSHIRAEVTYKFIGSAQSPSNCSLPCSHTQTRKESLLLSRTHKKHRLGRRRRCKPSLNPTARL